MPDLIRSRLRLASISLGLVIASACSSAPTGPDFGEFNADVDMSLAGPEQQTALMDAEVTEAEYLEGFDRFRACLSEAGYELRDVQKIGKIMSAGIPAEAVESGVEEDCYNTEYRFLDIIWQVNNYDPGPEIAMLNGCLEAGGFETGTELAEVKDLFDASGLDYMTCATDI